MVIMNRSNYGEFIALLSADSRFAVVVTFLAVLEMWHQSRISVEQDELFGPIYVLRAKATPPAAEDAPANESSDTPRDEPEKKLRRPRRSRPPARNE